MDFYPVWPYLFGMAAIMLMASTPLLKGADSPPTIVPSRVQTIDGLRGFLALGVFFHHAAIYHQFILNDKWELPPSHFYANVGQVGVSIFFMITGYLFWSQILKADAKPNFIRLYVGRIFRIVPLYLLLVMILLITVGVLSKWQLEEPLPKLIIRVLAWLAGGITSGGDLNNLKHSGLITAGVTWTLHYEWLFYGSLFLTTFIARKYGISLILPFLIFFAFMPFFIFANQNFYFVSIILFSIGMMTASVKFQRNKILNRLPSWVLSCVVLTILSLVLCFFHSINEFLPAIVLGIAFFIIIYDTTIFGLLLTRPAKRLGDVSYGIYLLQGPVLFFAYASPRIRLLAANSPLIHWSVAVTAALVLVLFSTVTHVLIERPGIKLGQRLLARLEVKKLPNSSSLNNG